MKLKWNSNDTVSIIPPARPKKITGTRFAAIMGLNRWTTPFNVWCAITRTYEEPFVDTIYTVAGKTIEPKQAEFMKKSYFMTNLITPTDMYGPDYFKKTYGDFFHDTPIFGGMWDYLLIGADGRPDTVLEMKTTKRSEDWADDIPEYYAMQAALYAYLLGVDRVLMVCSFLGDTDYANPDAFVPSVENTIVREFYVSERYPNMDNLVEAATNWWNIHVLGGMSPEYDEKADKAILDVLRSQTVDPDADMSAMLSEAEALRSQLEARKAELAPLESRYKVLTEAIKNDLMGRFSEGDKSVSAEGSAYEFTVSRANTTKYDSKAMKADGVYDKYAITDSTYKLTVKPRKEAS